MRLFIWRAMIAIGLGLLVTERASAIGNKAAPEPSQALLMMSDTHFNPFHDPAKVKQLAEAPANRWEDILASPDSPTQTQDFEALRMGCKLRGIDTPYSLFASAIQAIHRDAAAARFITISGDMLAHSFGCMFTKTQPDATPEQYMAFTAKTIEYEVLQLRHAVPGAPLYFALGNNDSECGDYRLDTATDWFRILAKVAEDGVGHTWDSAAMDSFRQGGYYSVEMPRPLKKTRMIVVNDMYLAGGYRSCKGEVNAAPAKSQMVWLQTQLEDARAHHERAWVIGHIPPGVSPYATFQQQKTKMDMCKPDGKPASFMPSDILGDTIARYGDVVKLSIFGHTHVDEMKLLDGKNGGVPVKNVSSLTAIGGNYPSFTIAQMNIATGELLDYTVVSSPDPQGSNWTKEYTFSEEYGRKGFTPETLQAIVAELAADPGGTTKLSEDYILHWSVGAQRTQLQPIWPGYVCGMNHPHAAEYKTCVCSSSLGPALGAATR